MSIFLKTIVVAAAAGMTGMIFRQSTNDAHGLVAVASVAQSQQVAIQSPASKPSANASQATDVDGLQRLHKLLQAACASAEAMSGYTAAFEMQEEVNNKLRPPDTISIKVRREPFSVFMRWNNNGQEALYVNGQNDNRLIVKPTAGLAALRRVWRLEPDSRMAMRTCRYPITEIGIEILTRRVYQFYQQHRDKSQLAAYEYADSTLQGRDVSVVNVKFKNKNLVPQYHSSKFCFDKETQLLVAVDNFGWTESGEPRLIEHYLYHQIAKSPTLTDEDFTEDNPAYQFVAR